MRRGSTLALAHGGQTYRTAAIPLSATTAEVQAAVDLAFSGLSGATATVSFWNGSELRVTFGGTLAGIDLARLTGTAESAVTPAALLQTIEGLAQPAGQPSTETLVVDYVAQPLTVPIGPGRTMTLDMDGQRGELLEAAG